MAARKVAVEQKRYVPESGCSQRDANSGPTTACWASLALLAAALYTRIYSIPRRLVEATGTLEIPYQGLKEMIKILEKEHCQFQPEYVRMGSDMMQQRVYSTKLGAPLSAGRGLWIVG